MTGVSDDPESLVMDWKCKKLPFVQADEGAAASRPIYGIPRTKSGSPNSPFAQDVGQAVVVALKRAGVLKMSKQHAPFGQASTHKEYRKGSMLTHTLISPGPIISILLI